MLSTVSFVAFLLLPAAFGHHVGFAMTRGHAEGPYISFDQIVSNDNADLNRNAGAFRCSEPGLYFFSFEAVAPREKLLILSLRKSRIPILTMYSSEGGFDAVSGSIVLRLRKGEIVYPYIEEGQITESDPRMQPFTSFSGFLVSREPRGELMFRQSKDVRNGTHAVASENDAILTVFETAGADCKTKTSAGTPQTLTSSK